MAFGRCVGMSLREARSHTGLVHQIGWWTLSLLFLSLLPLLPQHAITQLIHLLQNSDEKHYIWNQCNGTSQSLCYAVEITKSVLFAVRGLIQALLSLMFTIYLGTWVMHSVHTWLKELSNYLGLFGPISNLPVYSADVLCFAWANQGWLRLCRGKADHLGSAPIDWWTTTVHETDGSAKCWPFTGVVLGCGEKCD